MTLRMRAHFLSFVLLWAIPRLAAAQWCPGVTTQLTPFARETLTIDNTVKGLTSSIYKPSGVTPSLAIVSIEGGSIRYQVIGSAPTATEGHPLTGTPAQTFTICGIDSITAFKATRQSTDANLFITYYKTRP